MAALTHRERESPVHWIRSMLVLSASLVWLAPSAGAALVTWVFEGTVTSFQDSHAVLDGSVGMGASFDASITYETDLVDAVPADPTLADYHQNVPPGAFTAHVGSYTIAVPSMRILVYDDYVVMAQPPIDQIDFNTAAPFAFPGVSGASIYQLDIGLLGLDTSVLTSDAVPTSPPPLSAFEPSSHFLILLGCVDTELSSGSCTTSSIEIGGHLTSLPEPPQGGAGLVAMTLLASIGARRRKPALAVRAAVRDAHPGSITRGRR